MDLIVHFLSFLLFFVPLISLREPVNERLSSSCLALPCKCWGRADAVRAGGWQGLVHSPRRAAPALPLCTEPEEPLPLRSAAHSPFPRVIANAK